MASSRVSAASHHIHKMDVTWLHSGHQARGSFRPGPSLRRLAPIRISSSEEVQTHSSPSSRLLDFFCVVQHPTISNRPYSKALEAFVDECITMYECGLTERDLAAQAGEAAAERQRLSGRSGSLPADMEGYCERDFLDCVVIVWCTCMVMKGVARWALSPAVPEATLQRWRSFVGMIITAYVEKRMRWYPIERLQLELSAVQDLPLPYDTVAERARIVFTTLERLYPQFPE